MRKAIALMLMVGAVLLGNQREAIASPIIIRFDPNSISVNQGASFDIALLADIPDPVIGWGLDVNFNPGGLSLVQTQIESPWISVPSQDGDGLSALAFPNPISGLGIVLARLRFSAIAPGTFLLQPSITTGDLTEGFLLDTGTFSDIQFRSASVAVNGVANVPEPTSLVLLSCALIGVYLTRRRQSKNQS